MSQSKSSGTQNRQSGNQSGNQAGNQSEQDAAKERAGKTEKSSHDHMSRQKAGSDKGAGGGAKAKQGH
jgi:hypothetical protein